MPSDPNIALSVHPIAPPVSPLATLGALQNIQEGQARQALLATQQREAEANTADIDQKTQQANRSNQAYARAADILRDPAEAEKFGSGDISSLRRAGIDPKVVDELHTKVLDGLTKISTKSKVDFDLHQEQLGKLSQGLTGLRLWAEQNPGADLQGQYSAFRNSANTELKLAPGTLPEPGAVRQISDLDGIAAKTGLYLGMHAKVQEDRANEQKIVTDTAQGNKFQADADRTNAEIPGVRAEAAGKVSQLPVTQAVADATLKDPNLLTPDQRRQKSQADTLASIQRGELGVKQGELGVKQFESKQKYGDVLGEMAPNNRAIAEKLAVGDFDPAQLGRIPGKESIIAGAIAINPAWTQQTFATKKSFTDPEKSQAKNLGTISRIVGHIGRFEENSQKMGFSPLYASGMNLTGDQNKLHEDSHAIAGELEKLVSGGVGSIEQTKAWQKSLSSPSASARQQAIDEISQLIGSQYEGMNQTYKAGVGTDLPIEKYVSKPGQDWMKAKGINVKGSTGVKLIAPDGTVAEVPSDQVDHYLKLGAKKAQ